MEEPTSAWDDHVCGIWCFFPSVLWHCWLADRNGNPVCTKMGFSLLVMTVWLELCTYCSSNCDHHLCCPCFNKIHPPFPFGRICFVVLVMRKGGEISWSGPWHLVCTLEVFHVHSYRDQFIQPGWAECVFCVFSIGLYFVYSFVFLWFVCVSPSFYVSLGSWVIPLTVFGAGVTNSNEPPRTLAASTIMWVRS